MIEPPRPDVILTHESDLDGLISGMLLQRLSRKLFNADVPLYAYHYQGWRSREMRENAAWVADFVFDARLDKPNWLLFDHHPTEVKPERAQVVYDPRKSAGLLCYELCKEHGLGSPALDRLIHLNNVADLFLEDDPDFVLANDYGNLVKSYQFWNLWAIVDGKPENLLDHPLLEVMAAKRKVEDPIGLAWSRKNILRLSPSVGLVETVVGNNNMIVHQLLDDPGNQYPVLVTLFRKAIGPIIVSLRSRDGEAAKVAERLQGGGHPNAAGASLPKSVRSIPDAVEYLRKVLDPAVHSSRPLNSLEGLFASIETDRT